MPSTSITKSHPILFFWSIWYGFDNHKRSRMVLEDQNPSENSGIGVVGLRDWCGRVGAIFEIWLFFKTPSNTRPLESFRTCHIPFYTSFSCSIEIRWDRCVSSITQELIGDQSLKSLWKPCIFVKTAEIRTYSHFFSPCDCGITPVPPDSDLYW